MTSDADNGPKGGGEGGLSNLLALAAMSEVYLMNENQKNDRHGGGGGVGNSVALITCGAGDSPTVTTSSMTTATSAKSESPAQDNNKKSSPQPSMKNAPPSRRETAAAGASATCANDQFDDTSAAAPRGDESGVKSRTNSSKKRPKQPTSSQRAPQYQPQHQEESSGVGVVAKKKNQPSFPVILMAIMSGSQNREYITFLSDEQRFIIIDSVALETKVLPIHFEASVPSYEQFLQLLHLWGFEVLKDPNYPFVNVFRHPMFRKGDWEGCLQIQLPDREQASTGRYQADATSRRKSNRSNSPLSPIQNDVAEEATTRSVTPPKASSSSTNLNLLERRASAQVQTEALHPNLGLLLSSLPTNNAINRRVTIDSVPDEATLAFQLKLRECLLPWRNQGRMAAGMGNLDLQTIGRSSSMPMRRASLNDINMAAVAERIRLDGNFSLPMNNYRCPSLDELGAAMTPAYIKSHLQLQQMQRDRTMLFAPLSTTPSDAEVRSATQDIMTAAIDAMLPKRRRLSIDHLPNSGSTVHLDVITEIFLERSRKVLSSRPVSIMGPRSAAMQGNNNDDNNRMNTRG
ncbi:hypothetical protein ACHAWU_006366 [Discostella pseudostelligera]|uniref:HSF-type DNA-binding domain-containing protein n=1 Tax=Discostella pseudostelligera TaxID=259834 RepID=A0ABD3N4R6_9STRA